MRHVVCELTSMTSYRIIFPDGYSGGTRQYHCKLIFLPTKRPDEKPQAINPTHNEAWARMLEWSKADG